MMMNECCHYKTHIDCCKLKKEEEEYTENFDGTQSCHGTPPHECEKMVLLTTYKL